jgi:anthranilate/para-aminobenzoate synthase component I
MSDCNFDTIYNNLSNILKIHVSSRTANIEKIQQIKMNSMNELRLSNLQYLEEFDKSVAYKTELDEIKTKIRNHNTMLANKKKLRISHTTRNETSFLALQKELNDLTTSRNKLNEQKSDITTKNSEIINKILLSKKNMNEYIAETQNFQTELGKLQSSENTQQEMCASKKQVQQTKLSGLSTVLKSIASDINKDKDLKEMFNIPTIVSGSTLATPHFLSDTQGLHKPFPANTHPIQTNRDISVRSNPLNVGHGGGVLPEDDESSELNELSRKIQALNRHLALCKRTA